MIIARMPACPYNDTPVVDRPWDGPGNEAKIPNDAGASVLRRMYAWVDANGNADAKSSYALPHHEVANGEPGDANVNGVRNAMARLSGSRIPQADQAAVRTHLQRHLDKFNGRQGQASIDVDTGMLVGALQVEGRCWSVRPELLATLDALNGRIVAVDPVAARGRSGPQVASNGVAVVDLKGMLMPQASGLLALLLGAGGLDQFMSDFRSAIGNPDVGSVVLNVDSPGGLVDGIPEAAAEVRAARATGKPIVAVANTLAASAAYWLASQAHEIVVSPSSEVGSIGVYNLHRDVSAAAEQAGVKVTLVSAGKYKTEGNPYEPLGDEARQAVQTAVDDYYGMFVADVAAGRGVDPQEVQDGYGEGRTLTARRAVKAGLADRVATLGETVQRLGSGRAKVRRTEADDGDHEPFLSDAQPLYTVEERNRLLDVVAQLR